MPMLLLRRILFFVFCGLYLVICPMVVLHALGITFKPETQSLLRTGLIYISTIPVNARIEVNRRRYPETTPTIIRNLSPGEYFIKISLTDYLPWEKLIPVEEQQATSLENILLIPRHWEARQVSTAPARDLIPLPGWPVLLLRGGADLTDMFRYDIRHDLSDEIPDEESASEHYPAAQIFPPGTPYAENQLKRYFTAQRSPNILLQTVIDGEPEYLWVNIDNSPAVVKNLSELFSLAADPDEVLWSQSSPQTLFVIHKGVVSRLDAYRMSVFPEIASGVVSAALYRDDLYVLDRDYRLKRIDRQGNVERVLLKDSEKGRELFADAGKLEMTIYDEDLVIFRTARGALLSNHLPHELIKSGVRGAVYNKEKRRLAVWTKNKIGILDFSRDGGEDAFFEQGPELTWLDIKARDISAVYFANKGAQVIYCDRDKVMITESMVLNPPDQYEITRVKNDTAVKYWDKTGTLYYIDRKSGYLSFIQVRPEDVLFSFPETEEPGQNAEKKDSNEI